MPIRGVQNPWPKAGPKPSGIFSSKGYQKMDSNAGQPEQSLMKYALSNGGKTKPKARNNMLKG